MSAHIDPRMLDEATGAARRGMLAHVAACPACREAVLAHDPALLFGLLALRPVPDPTLDDVSAGVSRLLGRDHPSVGTRLQGIAWPRRVAVAAVVTLALLVGAALRQERSVAPSALSMSRPRADVAVDPGRGVSQVIDMTVGETQVVMVYNGDLKL